MAEIHILDPETVDQIAAGEVIERPSSIVKELVENSIDAGSSSISVEIKEGGIALIRVCDNGCGIEKSQIRKAFLRHATSKIRTAEDLVHVTSLGFRGEALSSISAVAMVELITKTVDDMTGTRVCMEGALETDFEEIGAPDGTTILVRNLFFNVPVRRKFLKQPQTEGGYVASLMEHLALSHPEISFQFIQNGQVRFTTPGNGNLKQVIYSLYGREMSDNIFPMEAKEQEISLTGFLGQPSLNRGNRNYELCFLNGRFVRSSLLFRAIEEGYRGFVMQHKYPFCILFLEVPTESVDINVHPTKMDVRFIDQQKTYKTIAKMVHDSLSNREMIASVKLADSVRKAEKQPALMPLQHAADRRCHAFVSERPASVIPEKPVSGIPEKPASVSREKSVSGTTEKSVSQMPGKSVSGIPEKMLETAGKPSAKPKLTSSDFFISFDDDDTEPFVRIETKSEENLEIISEDPPTYSVPPASPKISLIDEPIEGEQLELFEEKILSEDNRTKFQVLGQIFDTYWLVAFEDKLLMVDQHAAHEKVKYERIMKSLDLEKLPVQNIYPPIVLTLNDREQDVLERYGEEFVKLGFETEHFGGNEFTIRTAPLELFGNTDKAMFLEILDELDATGSFSGKSVLDRIATMACKAAVKGNMKLSAMEMEVLLDEMLRLDNPYFCPHGRPTMIHFTKQDLERKFKRIVN